MYSTANAMTCHLQLILKNNTAGIAGNSIYGGTLDVCVLQECIVPQRNKLTGILVFKRVFDIPWSNSLSEVTSDIEQVCFCTVDGKQPECSLGKKHVRMYPGQLVQIAVVAVGQLNGTNPAIVLGHVSNSTAARIPKHEESQQVGVDCQELNYTIRALENIQYEINLGISRAEGQLGSTQTVSVSVNTMKCPLGFELGKTLECSCAPLLERNKVYCFLEEQQFNRPGEAWIGLDRTMNEFLALKKCPLEKCRSERSTFTLDSLDSQCKEGFSGLLCGSCAANLSASLGNIACKNCTTAQSAVVILIFAVSGPLLLAAMLYGTLTVSKGTFSGFIFYANVVHVHKSLFFGANHTSVVTVLVAWLNLDLGIELCFYSGMTFYAVAWLQLLFPVYLMLLVFTLSCLNWYTTLGGKIIGNRISEVASTVMLLTYAKLLSFVAKVLTYAKVDTSYGESKVVWLYDGNVPYFTGKHTILFVAALITLVCYLTPFAVLVLLTYPILLWHRTRKLAVKLGLYHLLSNFQKPFKKSLRWWTGLLLLIRVLLVSLYQGNMLGNQSLSLIAIVTQGLCLMGTMWVLGSLYINKRTTAVESFYLSNLVLLAGWSQYVTLQHSQHILSYVLVTSTLLVFFATIIHHITKRIVNLVKKWRDNKSTADGDNTSENQCAELEESTGREAKAKSHTYIRVTGEQQPLSELVARKDNKSE